jgi:hypothetical protein
MQMEGNIMSSPVVEPKKRFYLGIDVGTVNCGIAIYEPARNIARLMIIDLLVDFENQKNIKMEESINEILARQFIDELAWYLERAYLVGVEKQMRRRFIVLSTAIVAIINERYDGICLFTSPKTIRHHFGISMGSYKERKQKSLSILYRYVAKDDLELCNRAFGKHVDAVEALLIAIWLHLNADEVRFPSISYAIVKRTSARIRKRPIKQRVRYRVADVNTIAKRQRLSSE